MDLVLSLTLARRTVAILSNRSRLGRPTGSRLLESSRLDWLLACLAAGAAATSLTVTTLLLAGLYYRPVARPVADRAACLPRVERRPRQTPALTVAADRARRSDRIAGHSTPSTGRSWWRRLASCVVYLLDAWTSPITWWDGLASWGKWAADWGRRTSSAHYVVGGYPQLVPRLVSVMYKLTGAHSALLPLDFFALHGFFVLFAAWFLLAGGQADAPAQTAGMAGRARGSRVRCSSASTPVPARWTSWSVRWLRRLLALYFGLRRGTWRARREDLVLGAVGLRRALHQVDGRSSGFCCCSCFDRAVERPPIPLAPERESSAVADGAPRRSPLPRVGMVPFLVEQGASGTAYRPLGSGSVRSEHLAASDPDVVVDRCQTSSIAAAMPAVRAGLVQRRLLEQLRHARDVCGLVLHDRPRSSASLASLASWLGRSALPLLVAYGAIWLYWSSVRSTQHLRAASGARPVRQLQGRLGSGGCGRRSLWQNGIAVMAGLFLVLAGGGLLKDTQARLTGARARRPRAAGAPRWRCAATWRAKLRSSIRS